MDFKNKYFVTFLIFLILSIPPIFIGIMIYKPILNVFPQFGELEIQDYYFVITIIFSLYSLFFIYSLKNPIQKFLNRFNNKVVISKFFLLIICLIQIGYVAYFYKYSYPALLKTSDFRDVGIITEDSFALPVLIFIIISSVIIFFTIMKFFVVRFYSFFYLFSIIIISLLTFKIASLNHHDFAYFAGPVNDLLHGKHLLYNSPSQYGFLSIISLTVIFKFIPLGLMNLSIVNAVIATLGFISVFVLLQFLLKNKLLSLFTIIFIIFLNYIIQIVPNITVLQTSFIRFGIWVVLALSICFSKFYIGDKYRKLLDFLPYLIMTIGFFWVLDNGTYMLLAFLFYKSFNHLKSGFFATATQIFYEILKVGGSIGIGFLIVKFIYNIFFNISPNWGYYLSDPSLYLGGFGLIALPNSSWYWIIIIGYLLMLTYIITIKRYSNGYKLNNQDNIFSFVLFYGIFQFSYFIGRSHLNNLHHVIIPFLVCLFFLIDQLINSVKKNSGYIYCFLLASVFSLLLCLPMYFIFTQGSKNLTTYNFFTTLDILKHRKAIEQNYIYNTLQATTLNLLRDKYADYISKQGITLISINDIWYLIDLKIANNVESNNLRYFVRDEPLKKIAAEIVHKRYKYVFIDQYMGEDFAQVERIYVGIKNYYREKERLGSLIVLERI